MQSTLRGRILVLLLSFFSALMAVAGEPFTLVVEKNDGSIYMPHIVIRVDYADGRQSERFEYRGPRLDTAKDDASREARKLLDGERPGPQPPKQREPEPKPVRDPPEPKPTPAPKDPKPRPCNPKYAQCPEP